MRRPAILVSLFLSAAPLVAQYAPTRCQLANDSVLGTVPVKILLTCDPSFADDVLWHLDRIDQVSDDLDGQAYRGHGGKGAVIYILDTGVLATHDEFMTETGTRVIAGFDATTSISGSLGNCTATPALEPCGRAPSELSISSHGTGVASIAAGNRVGVAPEALLVSVRTVSVNSPGATLQTLSEGLDFVIRHAWDAATPPFRTGIINISFAISKTNGTIAAADVEAKIRRMTEGVDKDGNADVNGKRFFFAIATGNNDLVGGCDSSGNPTLFPETIGPKIDGVMTVAGSTRDNRIWDHSCRGEEVFAPAEDVFVASSSAHNHYRADSPTLPVSGTSWSAPIVAGIAARLLDQDPSRTPQELESIIKSSASRLNSGEVEATFLPPPAGARRRAARP
jgi:subtilisin family serine protease